MKNFRLNQKQQQNKNNNRLSLRRENKMKQQQYGEKTVAHRSQVEVATVNTVTFSFRHFSFSIIQNAYVLKRHRKISIFSFH